MATIQGVYLALFGRPADPLGLAFFNTATNNGANLAGIGPLQSSAEFQARFTGQTNVQIINSIYQSLFNRDADLPGLTFFSNALANGTLSINNIAIAIYDGAQGADKTIRDLKEAAANAFTTAIDTTAEVVGYAGTAAADAGRTFIAGVTTTAPTADQVTAAVATATSGTGAPGTNFALTDAVDIFNGAGGNDVFIAALKGTTATLAAGDALDGGAGTDRLNTFGNDNAAAVATATIKNIEQVYAQFANAGTLNVSGNAAVKEAWFAANSAGASAITLAKTQTGGLEGAVGATATFTFTDVAGAADTANIALSGATATTGVTIAGIETLNIAAVSGKSSLGTLTAAATATANITGAGSVTATISNDATFKTIDASKNTGGIDIDASAANAANQVLTITGTSAADTYTTLFANLASTDKIALGGGTDTLAFTDATDLSTTTKAAVLAGVTEVETLKVNGAVNFLADGDALSQTTFSHNSTGAFTGTTFSSTDKLVIGAVDIANSTVAMKLGQNTFNVDLVGTKTAVVNASNLTVTGASTVNVSSAGQPDVGSNILDLVTDANGTVNLVGAKDLTLTLAVNAGTTGLSLAAGTYTGKLNVTGTANADALVGGSGADTFNVFGNGVDVLTGGGGKDKFVVFGADADVNAATILVTDEITDFVTGTDSLGGFGAAGSATNFTKAAATSATLAAFLATADTALDGAVKYYVGQVGSDTYVAFDDDGNGFTSLVKLTGVALAGVVQADVVA